MIRSTRLLRIGFAERLTVSMDPLLDDSSFFWNSDVLQIAVAGQTVLPQRSQFVESPCTRTGRNGAWTAFTVVDVIVRPNKHDHACVSDVYQGSVDVRRE